MHCVENLFLARLPGISANVNKNYRRWFFLLIFPEILNFRKIHNPSVSTKRPPLANRITTDVLLLLLQLLLLATNIN